MTVVAGALTKSGHITLAADNQTTDHGRAFHSARPKVWVDGQWALGASGDLRTIQVLRHHVDWPRYRPDEEPDLEAFLVRQVVAAMRYGVDGHDIDKDDMNSISLLMASGSTLVEISGNGCVYVDAACRAAIGSGSDQALGRLGDLGPWKPSDVIDAVARANQTDLGCSGPIHVVDTETLRVREA